MQISVSQRDVFTQNFIIIEFELHAKGLDFHYADIVYIKYRHR